jgi:hypothetical protein
MGITRQVLTGSRNKDVLATRAATNYLIETPSGVKYRVFSDSPSSDVYFIKSTNNGFTWNDPVLVSSAITCTYLTVWYDRWSGINGDLIHCAYIDDTNDIVLYRNINAGSSDALSTEYTIWDFTSQAAGGCLSLTRTRGGNLICGMTVDAGVENFAKKSTDVGVNWTDIAALGEAINDQVILLPGFAADNQDAIAIFWDATASELSRKLYDDSANSWGESSIATSMTMIASSTSYPHFAAAVDITNSQILLVAWSNVDTLNADLRCWKITESEITEVTNVVLNSTDDQGFCSIGIDTNTNYWYVFYGGKSDGSEVYPAVNIYYKVSMDAGVNWGSETQLTNAVIQVLKSIISCPRFINKFSVLVVCNNSTLTTLYDEYIFIDDYIPKTTGNIGG